MRPIFVFLQNRPNFGAQIVHTNSLHALRTQFPERRIVIIGKYPEGQLCLELGVADEWHNLDKQQIRKKAQAERPSHIINFGPRNLFPAILARLVGARLSNFRHGVLSSLLGAKVPYSEQIYRGTNYARLLQAHGFEIHDYPAHPLAGVHDQILIMPGGTGGSEDSLQGSKKWGADRFYELYRRLQQAWPQYEYTFVLGPLETTEQDWLLNQPTPPNIAMKMPVADLFAKVRHARLVIANDCGPSHIAHTLRKDMVQIFAGPNPEWFLPRPGAIELHGTDHDIRNVTIDEVENAARSILELPQQTAHGTQADESSGAPSAHTVSRTSARLTGQRRQLR